MVRSQPNNTNAEVSVAEEIAYALAVGLARTMWMLVRLAFWFPMISVPLAGCGAVFYWHGRAPGIASLIAFAACLVAWRVLHPASFRRWITTRIRARWRRWATYTSPWADICALHRLTKELNEDVLVPRLERAVIGVTTDLLTVRMLAGQSTTDWAKQSEALAHAFKAESVQVRTMQPGWIQIHVRHHDTLNTPVPAPAPVEPIDLTAVRAGIDETGRPWVLRILGRHILIAGATGSGKGGVAWSLLVGLAPSIRDGYTRVWVVDPKGGMEFGAGRAMFDRFAYDAAESTLGLLRDAVAVMTGRANRLRGITRQHVPTSAEPLIVVIIDEIASLTSYISDRKIKTEVEQLLGLLLSQGRAVGVSVIACVQDPSKDVLTLRQLFPTRVALRMSETSQAVMVLGQGARDRGALCELIPESTPGVAYVTEDGSAEVTRVRAFHVTDSDIDTLRRTYRPPTTPAT